MAKSSQKRDAAPKANDKGQTETKGSAKADAEKPPSSKKSSGKK